MSGINPPVRKGKKLRKRGRSHIKREKHSSSIRDFQGNSLYNGQDHERFDTPTNQAEQISNSLFQFPSN